MPDITGVAAILLGGVSARQQRPASGAVSWDLAQQVMFPPIGGTAGRTAEQALSFAGKRLNRGTTIFALNSCVSLDSICLQPIPPAKSLDGVWRNSQLFSDLAIGTFLFPVVED